MMSVLMTLVSCGSGDRMTSPSSTDTIPDVVIVEPTSVSPSVLDVSSLKEVKLWATWYNLPKLTNVPDGVPVRNKQGQELGYNLSLKEWCDLAMEGSGTVGEVTLNYAGTTRNSYGVDCKKYFRNHPAIKYSKFYVTKHPYGVGNKNNPLTPFKSIACDQRRYKFGSTVLIPSAVGVKLPNGEIHDGVFTCEDVGGAIKGNHIDVYIGPYKKNPFKFVKSNSSGTFSAKISK